MHNAANSEIQNYPTSILSCFFTFSHLFTPDLLTAKVITSKNCDLAKAIKDTLY